MVRSPKKQGNETKRAAGVEVLGVRGFDKIWKRCSKQYRGDGLQKKGQLPTACSAT